MLLNISHLLVLNCITKILVQLVRKFNKNVEQLELLYSNLLKIYNVPKLLLLYNNFQLRIFYFINKNQNYYL